MQVHLRPELQAKLDQWATETGRAADELVEEAMVGYFGELAELREMLDRRYDDLTSGSRRPITGAEALAVLREKTKARRSEQHG